MQCLETQSVVAVLVLGEFVRNHVDPVPVGHRLHWTIV